MAKTKISEYSATSADNTDISNINIAEGCSPANLNNAIRTIMAQLKDQQDGTSGDNFTVGGNLSVTGTSTLTGNVTAPTQSSSDNSTKVATTAFVTTKVGTLGTMSSQNANAVTISGGTITGITDLTVADGGTGVSTNTPNAILIGNGTSAITSIKPSTNNNVLTSTAGSTVTAGSFVVGTEYTILTVGTTSFTSIGASANTIGIVFTATGVGSGTGTATTNTWTSATPSGGLGIGQTWKALSLANNTNYTNSTSKPILVNIYLTNGGVSESNVYVDGIFVGANYGNSTGGYGASTVSAIVPVNSVIKYVLGSAASAALAVLN